MSAPALWALSPHDFQAHAVTDPGEIGMLVARCGHTMPRAAGLHTVPRASLCPSCVLTVAPDVGDRAELLRTARDAQGLGPWFGS